MYKTLVDCPLFRGLSEGQIEEMLEDSGNYSVTTYAKGDIIARRDTAYSGLMIILRGSAVGEMTDSSGKHIRVESLEAPQPIAPAYLFGGYNRLPVDVIAQTEVEILTLHRGLLFELMQENTILLSNFIDIISNKADVWAKRIYFLSFKSLKQKLALYLLDSSTESNSVVPVPDITVTADYFGATRSSLLSVVEDLKKKRVINTSGDKITILNRKYLEDIT